MNINDIDVEEFLFVCSFVFLSWVLDVGYCCFSFVNSYPFLFLVFGGGMTVHRAGVRESEFIGYQTAQAS